jgi:hypothetical protein
MSKTSNVARRLWLLGATVMLLVGSLGIATAPARADSTKKTVESVGKMLKDGGFKAKLDSDSKQAYILEFTTKSGYAFPIIISVDDDVMVLRSYIAPAAKVTRTPDLAAGLLEANESYAFLKIIFDKKGNLVFRYDAYENMIDADDLKKLINTMVENTVNFYTNAPFIKK